MDPLLTDLDVIDWHFGHLGGPKRGQIGPFWAISGVRDPKSGVRGPDFDPIQGDLDVDKADWAIRRGPNRAI